MRERGPPDPPGARGESGDSDIEEVGRTYRQLPEAHGTHSLASSSFDWGSSSFTSTLDVDAIKVLITIAPALLSAFPHTLVCRSLSQELLP